MPQSEWLGTFGELWGSLAPEQRQTITGLLPDGWAFDGRRILDFGCGPGLTLREFRHEAAVAEFWGVDVDEASVATLSATLVPPMHGATCGYSPPLPFDSSSFDLAWAISVFTHLTDNSIPWLLELHRILKPDGLLIATYMGAWMSEFVAAEPWDENRIGMNVLRHNHPWADGGPIVLISEWWLREHWGRAFEVVRIAEPVHNFSWVLMRKRDVELTADDVECPSDDPREFYAVRHNLHRAQREIEVAQDEFAAALHDANQRCLELQRTYERSLSWRATRPFRQTAQALRSWRARRSSSES